jgi:MutS domain V
MDTSAAPRQIYADRLTERTQRLAASSRRRDRIGYLRLLVFVGAVAIIWYAFHGVPIWWIAVPIAIFILLMWWQARFEREAECARRAMRFFERGIARLENRWQGAAEDGARFADPHHPYASDLDLFGRASLFELLSTARTRGGEERLAHWLKSASATDELTARHAAIDELRPMLELREQLAVLGDDYRTGVNPDQLVKWSALPAQPFPLWSRILALIFSLITAAMLVWWLSTDLKDPNARTAVIVIGAIEGLFALSMRTKILGIVLSVEEPARDLDLLSRILATLEKQQFRSPLLAALRKAIDVNGRPASHRIARLRRLIELLDSRDNPFIRALGPLVLWTTQVGMAIEAWRAANGPEVAGWLDAVSGMEALSSLANYAWERPSDPFPRFAPHGSEPCLDGEELGHPLLPDAQCVRNSVTITAPLQLLVVSGSNMSGKSTLLRTIGVNTVLALAGAPVRAKRMTISHLSLGASIRTTDSLEEGHSRFMAEILRLKQVLELPPPALFLLDELLGGTNSHDRALGSEGLIRALLARGAIGLVTTHDLTLSRIGDELAPAAANVHFEDRLENGRLIFDYLVRPGVVERSNALDLMRAVGLDV